MASLAKAAALAGGKVDRFLRQNRQAALSVIAIALSIKPKAEVYS